MREVKQSVARNVLVFMTSSSDHLTGATGLTLTITASKDGAAFATITPTVTDLGSGWYKLALTTTHTNTLGDLALHITASGADPSDVLLSVVANLEADSVALLTGTGAVTFASLAVTGTTTFTGNVALQAGLTATQSSVNSPCFSLTGNGTGAGFSSLGGATGKGGLFQGGASGAIGLDCQGGAGGGTGLNAAGDYGICGSGTTGGLAGIGTTNGKGFVATGAGSGAGAAVTGNVTVSGTTTFTGAVTASAGVTGNVTGNLVGNVTGTVASVVGNVGGNVLGSVATLTTLPSIPANWLTAAGMAADARAAVGAAVRDVNNTSPAASSLGEAVNNAAAAGDPMGVTVPGTYAPGTAGYVLGTNLNATISSRPTAVAISTQVATDLATAHGAGSWSNVTVSDKTGFVLAAAGLDSVTATVPTGVAGNFRQQMTQVWWRFYGVTDYDKDNSLILTKTALGSTITTQAVTSDTHSDLIGAAT